MTAKRTHIDEDDALPALPPLDDDGETLGDDIPDELVHEDHLDLDDATFEDEQRDSLASDLVLDDDGGGLDDAEASVQIDEAAGLVVGDERGLLEGSDEGDGRDATADEVAIFDDDGSVDDGGAEGTGEDPALGIDRDRAASDASELRDEDEDDDAPLDAALFTSEPGPTWPATADVTWSVAAVPEAEPRAFSEAELHAGAIVVDRARGELLVSIDEGRTFRPVDGCVAVTAVVALRGASHDRVAVAALFDAARELSAIAVVRATKDAVSAEIVAEIAPAARLAADDDEHARVDALSVESTSPEIVVVAYGPFGRVRLRGR